VALVSDYLAALWELAISMAIAIVLCSPLIAGCFAFVLWVLP
jgi:hypothetical protein